VTLVSYEVGAFVDFSPVCLCLREGVLDDVVRREELNREVRLADRQMRLRKLVRLQSQNGVTTGALTD